MALSLIAKEKLERELLLTKGGGVYYDAARVDPDETTATLFIGLGGTGADVLIRIKNEVKRRMVLPQINGTIVGDAPKNIGFLELDTDASTMKKTWGTAAFDQFGTEFCSLAVNGLPSVVATCKKRAESGDPAWSWYDGIDAVGAREGANGIRQIGRLMLFMNIANVYDDIKKKMSGAYTAYPSINGMRVIVVAGIAGGTGSGTVIDVAYLVRKAAEELSIVNVSINGYLVMPDVNLLNGGDARQLWANGFACLKEIDYWMAPGEAEQNDRFVQRYNENISANGITANIFDFCHLSSATDMENHRLKYNDVITGLAETVFAYIAGEVGVTDAAGVTAMTGMYDNIKNYMAGIAAFAELPASYRYLTLGTHKLEIPYEEISTLLAIRLFERMEETFALRPTEETFKTDMRALGLSPTAIIQDSLMGGIKASPLDNPAAVRYDQIWGKGMGAQSNNLFTDVHTWQARDVQPTVSQHYGNFAKERNGIFLEYIKTNMKKPDRGPMYLTAMLKSTSEYSIIHTFDKIIERCYGIAQTCHANRSDCEKELYRAFEAGKNKIIGRAESVNAYINALREWINNEIGCDVYVKRAEVIIELRDKFFTPYYEKIFSKLADVLEALPEIFRTNLTHITIKQKEASEKGLLDDTCLIWPLDFERDNKQEFNRMLADAQISFLDNLTSSLSKWTGSDLDDLETTKNTDVPGYISQFISAQFGGLLNINMEAIMSAKMGTNDLDTYAHTELLRLRNRSIPMFNIRPAQQSISTSEFSITSVPSDSLNILSSARTHIVSTGNGLKISKEKTRLYTVKVTAGLPLYAYGRTEAAEIEYEKTYSNSSLRKGLHLDGKWATMMPSPLPEGSWTPNAYSNERVAVYNRRIRAAFDTCVKNNIITPDNPDAPTVYRLYIADAGKADFSNLMLQGSIDAQLSQLDSIHEGLWSSTYVELPSMGTSKPTLLERARESVLRLPKLCAIIEDQTMIAEKFAEQKQKIADPRSYAYAIICGLVIKRGYEMIYRNSVNAASFDTLYDITQEKSFPQFETYQAFREKLTDERRASIDTIRAELLRRISGEDNAEKQETLERINSAVAEFEVAIPAVNERISSTELDKRATLLDALRFYETAVSTLKSYRDNYLK